MKFRIQNYPNYTIEDDAIHTVYGPRGALKVTDGKVQIKIDGTPKRVKVSDLWNLREDDFNIAEKPAAAENVLSNHAYVEKKLNQFEADTHGFGDKIVINSGAEALAVIKNYADRGWTYNMAAADWVQHYDISHFKDETRAKMDYRLMTQKYVGDEYSGSTNVSALKRYAAWKQNSKGVVTVRHTEKIELPEQIKKKYNVNTYEEYLTVLNGGIF